MFIYISIYISIYKALKPNFQSLVSLKFNVIVT